MTAIEPRTIDLHVDRDLLEHRTHLPETVECQCGYHRDVNRYFTIGTLRISETGFELPLMHVTCGFRPTGDWFGNADGFCGATAPWPAYPSQCVGKPGHDGHRHASLSDDWADRTLAV